MLSSNETYGLKNPYYANVNQQERTTQPMMPYLPTGDPTGPSPINIPRPATPVRTPVEQAPTTLNSTLYTPGYLKTLIGKTVRVEFLIGTNAPLIDRTGVLVGVGASYILLRLANTDDIMMCDIYSIKFVTVFY